MAEEKKESYEVLEGETITHNGQDYSEGQTLELTEKQAKSLVDATVIKKVGTPTPPKAEGGSKKSPGGEMFPPTGGIPK